jgi:hypothetical protein
VKTVEVHSRKRPGLIALVDDDDYEAVSRYRWNPYIGGRARSRGQTLWDAPCIYAHARIDGRWRSMHHFLTGWLRVDHEDHNGLNNQHFNLRKATDSQNGANRRKFVASSTFKGVTWNKKAGKWQAQIKVNGQSTYLGLFSREQDAAAAYDAAARECFGEFAYVNDDLGDPAP